MTVAALAILLATSDPAWRVMAVSVAGITAFATRSLPEATIALFIFLAFLGLDVAPQEVIFSGFAASGFWLLVGGLVIGSAITSSGLGERIAGRIFALTGPSYPRAVWFLSFAGLALGALVPSAIPRVIVMMPITLALARRMNMAPGSRGHTGLLMTAAMMTLVPTYAFLTANLPTIIELGIIEILYDQRFTYGAYFVQNAPINALRFVVLLVMLLAFGRGLVPAEVDTPADGGARLTPSQRRLSLVLILAVGLWATDTLHGIAPAWITLVAAMVLLLPGVGVLSAQAMKTEIDLSIAFLIAAVFCISAVITEIGLGQQIAEWIVPALRLSEGEDLWNLTAITGFSSALSHLTIAPATPIVLAPLAEGMSEATGWSIEAIAMGHNLGVSTTALPYQSPPLLIGIAIAGIPVGALTRLCLVSALLTSLVGIPLTWAWWLWLGFI
jgi:di/tricarboxylate transporter